MEQLILIIDQICIFAILIALGFLMAKLHILDRSGLQAISRLIIKLILPIFIFYNSITSIQRDEIMTYLPILPASVFAIAVLFLCGKIAVKVLRLPPKRAGVAQLLLMFGNVGFIGIPVITQLYPQVGMACISVYTVVDQSLLWTLGMSLVQHDKQSDWRSKIAHIFSPSLISVFLAALWILLEIPLPHVASGVMSAISGSTMSLPLLFIGGNMFYSGWREIAKEKSLYILAILRMLLLPLIVYSLLRAVGLTKNFAEILTILSGIPSLSVTPVIAKEQGADAEYAAGGVMLMTVGCMVTLPVLMMLFRGIENLLF